MLRPLRYITPYFLYVLAFLAFTTTGIYCWVPLIYLFFLIPLVELLIKPDSENLTETQEEEAKSNPIFDFVLWLTVPLQIGALYLFLTSLDASLTFLDTAGRVVAMGLLCGTFGINAAHELGHRVNKFEQFLAKVLLLTSLYMHFFIEHNKGHHKHVATPEDPSTAFYKQHLYAFWIQTFIGTQKKAWQIATAEAKSTIFNEMALFQLIQFVLVGLIYYFLGGFVLVCFLVAAFIGAALLETVNYIEHYGLQRDFAKTTYERVKPAHSWNSNHLMGRLTLFELSRHSDHHYLASRKYQILRHLEEAPQMPTGYPGMILLALFPPVWFKVMHRQMDRFGIIPQIIPR
jgi:alkane 1-monooxygenase